MLSPVLWEVCSLCPRSQSRSLGLQLGLLWAKSKGPVRPTMKEKAIRLPSRGAFIHSRTHSFTRINSLMHSFTLQMLNPSAPSEQDRRGTEEGCCRPWERRCRSPEVGAVQSGLAQSVHRGLPGATAIITVHSGTLSCLERSPRACPWWLPVPQPQAASSLLPVSMSPPI